jgi:hypothetical protein
MMDSRTAHRRAQVTSRAWHAQPHDQSVGDRWQQASRPHEWGDRETGFCTKEEVS